jgi:hypothetical protein
MNENFREILTALFAEESEFLIVGAFAVARHGFVRGTERVPRTSAVCPCLKNLGSCERTAWHWQTLLASATHSFYRA